MHPVLFQIPLPRVEIPLLVSLLVLSGLGLLVAIVGWRVRARDLLMIGAAFALGGAGFAWALRGQSYQLHPLPIYSYGLLLAASFVVGWWLTTRLVAPDGIPRNAAAAAYFVTGLSALLGARLLYVLTNWESFGVWLAIFDFRSGGLVAYGGFLGGFVGAWAYARRARISLLAWGDAGAAAVACGLGVTRVGCYLFGCDFGRPLPASAPTWLRSLGTFPRWDDPMFPLGSGSPAWQHHVEHRGLAFDSLASLPVHPTQLYESLLGFLLLALALVLHRRRAFRGQVLLVVAFAYGCARFLLEALRDDPERGGFGPNLVVSTWVPLLAALLAVAFALGPARSFTNRRWRVTAIGAALLVPVLVARGLAPEPFAGPERAPLSTSQWIGMLTALLSAAAYGRLRGRAAPHR